MKTKKKRKTTFSEADNMFANCDMSWHGIERKENVNQVKM